MQNPMTLAPAPQQARGGTAKSAPVQPMVPFIRASSEHREPAGIDITRTLTTSDQDLGVFDVPAYGYLRSLFILVRATGGTGTSLTFGEDVPLNYLKSIALTEPNGATIAQFSSGYGLAIAGNKWGGYRAPHGADPRQSPIYINANSATVIASTFGVRIPIEINLRDALGALPNQNAAATFKLRLTLAGSGQIVASGTITLQPSVRVQVFLEAWDQPELSGAGQANQITPPAVNTTQFWSEQVYNVSAGQQTIRFTRVGNYLRNLVIVYRAAGTSRATGQAILVPSSGNWPDVTTLYLDTRPLDLIEKHNWVNQMFERTGFGATLGATTPTADAPGGLDNGVFVYDFAHEFDGGLGRENRDLWLPTQGSTRLEIQGTFGAAGTLTVYTNDVAIAGTVFL